MRAAVKRGRLLAAVIAFSAVTLVGLGYAPEAKADGSVGWFFQASADGVLVPGNNLQVPSGTGVGPRSIGGSLRLNSNTFYAGVGTGFGLTTRHLVIPILSVNWATSTGLYDEQLTSVDGSIAHIRPWTGSLWDLGLPGLGVRTNERRWTFAATARTGVNIEIVNADAAYGNGTYDLGTKAINPYLRLDLEVCRRLDPIERMCLVASPNIYAYDQTFHGGMLSFRYELGK